MIIIALEKKSIYCKVSALQSYIPYKSKKNHAQILKQENPFNNGLTNRGFTWFKI